MSKNKNYPLASARRRIIAKACDFLFIISINIGVTISLTFFTFDSSFTKILDNNGWLFSLMLLVSNLIFIGMWWTYFVLIVHTTKGYTLFGKIFSIRLIWKEDDRLYRRIFNHEFLSIVGICFSNLLISLISFAFSDPMLFITNTFGMNNIKGINDGIKIASSVMITLYVLSCFPLIGVIVNTAMNSHTTTYLDDANALFVIHVIENEKTAKIIKSEPEHNLPGDIDIDELEKII